MSSRGLRLLQLALGNKDNNLEAEKQACEDTGSLGVSPSLNEPFSLDESPTEKDEEISQCHLENIIGDSANIITQDNSILNPVRRIQTENQLSHDFNDEIANDYSSSNDQGNRKSSDNSQDLTRSGEGVNNASCTQERKTPSRRNIISHLKFEENHSESEDDPFYATDEDPDFIPSDINDSSDDCHIAVPVHQNNYNQAEEAVTVHNNYNNQEEIKKPRKRIRAEDTWKVSKRKKNTLSGREHISKTGNVVPAKTMKPGSAPCRKKCTEKIEEDTRRKIFNNYWNTNKNWDLKRQFVAACVKSKSTSRRRPADGSRGASRKQTISYSFEKDNHERVEVCKVFFLNTLGISETTVRNTLKKRDSGGFVTPDKRGRKVPPNKLPEEIRNKVRMHIQSFPTYESHYSRNRTSKKYLGSELNIDKMYNLYKEMCEEEKLRKDEVAKSWVYRSIFNTEFNLAFKVPSTDTCDRCDTLKLSLQNAMIEEDRVQQTQEYDNHLQDAEKRYTEKRKDKKQSPEKTKVIMLDLQKCLPTPYLTNSQAFYLLKLWTLNLTIYDATEKKSYCLVWDESQAGRGGHEIAAALIKWAKLVLQHSEIDTLIIWLFLSAEDMPTPKVVIHKFLLRGHTHMEADHVHALIERTIKKQPTMKICTPWDWQQLIRSTGATVLEMELQDFKDFEVLYSRPGSKFFNNKQNTEKEKFLISSAVWLEVRAEEQGMLYYKTSIDDVNYKVVNMNRSVRCKIVIPMDIPPIRATPKGITKKKYDHLITLLKWVPIQFHNFYRNLHVANQEDDASDD